MNRKTLGTLVIFLVLLGVVYFIQTRPEKGQRVGEKDRPLAKLDEKDIQQLTITAKGNTVVLEREGKDKWKLTKPVVYPADESAVKSVLEKIAGLEFGDVVTELKSKHSELQVDEKTGVHVVGSDGKKVRADFFLGKDMDGFSMFRLNGKDQVYQVVGSLRNVFERETKNWRNRSILDFKQDDARKLTVTTAEGSIVLTRADEKTDWKVSQSSSPVGELDKSTVSSLLSTLSSLSCADFADDITPEKAGLNQPQATLIVELKTGGPLTLIVGANKGDDYWTQKKGQLQIFVIKKYTADNLIKRPIDFREKSMLSFKKEDVVSFTIQKKKDKSQVTFTYKDDKWQADGKPAKDNDKVKSAIEALSSLKAEGFAKYSAKELGLDKPDWLIRIQLKDRSTYQLTVGSVEKDGHYGVVRKGISDIFVLRKYALDRFLLDPKEQR